MIQASGSAAGGGNVESKGVMRRDPPPAMGAGTSLARQLDDAGEETKYLTFEVGGTAFGMHILRVKEILEYNRINRVPMASSLVRGVINLRGQVVPVLDLAVRLGEQPRSPTRRTCIIIVDLRQGEDVTELGFMVDAVTEVVEIPVGMIEPPPAFGTDMPAEFIQGMGKVEGGFVTLLQLERIFDLDELARLAG
ncbi:MAG: chemotaxis protein CheW [Pseudomonadota bacterium]